MNPEEAATLARIQSFFSHFDPAKPAEGIESDFFKAKRAEAEKNNGRFMREKQTKRFALAYPKGNGIAVTFADGGEPPDHILPQ